MFYLQLWISISKSIIIESLNVSWLKRLELKHGQKHGDINIKGHHWQDCSACILDQVIPSSFYLRISIWVSVLDQGESFLLFCILWDGTSSFMKIINFKNWKRQATGFFLDSLEYKTFKLRNLALVSITSLALVSMRYVLSLFGALTCSTHFCITMSDNGYDKG